MLCQKEHNIQGLVRRVMAWTPGQELQDGKYIIERPIGRGSFGITYRARTHTGDRVVIKTLNETIQQRPDFAKIQQDFLKESLQLSKCTHPHIVRIDEVIQEEHLWCVVMEYVPGETLANRVQYRGILSEAEALLYIQQIGEALNAVHNNGLLHRDVKPINIMLRQEQSKAVLIDFSLARKFARGLTQAETEFRADYFAAIEQYDRRAKRGTYTDIYGLAATLYAILTGQVPALAPGRAAGMPLYPPSQINPRISARVNQAILKGMALKPESRPQSVPEWFALFGSRLAINFAPAVASQAIASTISSPPTDVNLTPSLDYSKLEKLLAGGNWQAADAETKAIALKIADREKQEWLRVEDIKNLPCGNLRAINQLWVKYSNGRFGFSVQKHIWESVGGTPNANLITYERFCDRIGWRVNESPIWGDKLNFTLQAPVGHLPCQCVEGSGWIGKGWGVEGNSYWSWVGSLCDRIETCGL